MFRENVWPPNIIKHYLVTKHADVEVSGRTAKNMFDSKHQSNSTSKDVWARNYQAYLTQREISIWRNIRLRRFMFKGSY